MKNTLVESNEVQVYIPIRTMPVPELADPTDISDTGYTARWYPVERAMGYAVRHFLKHTARSDEEYTLVHEDLETITEGTFECYSVTFMIMTLINIAKCPVGVSIWVVRLKE